MVVQNTNNIQDTTLRWPIHAERSLEKYMRAGGGLYILHSANNAFSHWKEYDKMIGLGWRPATAGYALEIDSKKNILRIPPGRGMGTGHGDRFNALIKFSIGILLTNIILMSGKRQIQKSITSRAGQLKISPCYLTPMIAQVRKECGLLSGS